ncbi:MAG: amino acid permease, partial [Gemmatimonadota bacterium]
ALAEAGRAAFGLPGLIAVSVAAAFSTASAINATLFATGRLAAQVAHDGELPGWFESRNSAGVPDRAVILLALATLTLLAVGSLRELVESASLAFLSTFACVNAIATIEFEGRHRCLSALGALGAGAAAIALTVQWIREDNWTALLSLAALLLLSFAVRPILLRGTVKR